MIAHLNGKIIDKSSTDVIIECGGVGYLVLTSVKTSEKLPGGGDAARIHTLLIPREDAMNLYGFYSREEKEIFLMLISVSGIGAKIALGILSAVTPEELQSMITKKDILSLKKLPGIGKKTAERIVVELKDKMLGVVAETSGIESVQGDILIRREAVSALTTLGYAASVAEKAVDRVYKGADGKKLSAEELIRKSLQFVMK